MFTLHGGQWRGESEEWRVNRKGFRISTFLRPSSFIIASLSPNLLIRKSPRPKTQAPKRFTGAGMARLAGRRKIIENVMEESIRREKSRFPREKRGVDNFGFFQPPKKQAENDMRAGGKYSSKREKRGNSTGE
jgi:hypothetical protein